MSEWEALRAILRELRAVDCDFDYALVGEDIQALSQVIDSDVDIVCDNASIKQIHALLSTVCNTLDLHCIQILQHERHAYYYVLTWEDGGSWRYLRLDICGDYVRNARLLMTADELLTDRQKDAVSGLYIPAAEKNLLYYLLKKIDKGAINERQFIYLKRNLEQTSEDVLPQLCRYWPLEHAQAIINCLNADDLAEFQRGIPVWCAVLKARFGSSLRSRVGDSLRLVRRILKPTGLVIAVYGPDGCGKTSVIERLKPSLLPAFRNTAEYHFRPFLGYSRKSESVTVSDPHARMPRNPVMSVLKLGYYALDFILGYFLRVLSSKIRSTFVVFDRYYDDLMIDPRRYCYGGPRWLLNAVRFFIPRPDLVFCLDADPEILQSRKTEVSFDECKRQREAYRALAEKLSNGHVIDASQALDGVVKDVQSIIHIYMAGRKM